MRRSAGAARIKRRSLVLLVLLSVCFAAVLVRLTSLHTTGGQRLRVLAAEQRERRFEIAPDRGTIFDRDGSELAMSLEASTLFANPRFVPDPASAAKQLASILGADEADLAAKLSSDKGFVYLSRKVDPALADRVLDLGIPGIDVFSEPQRVYPSGSLASHVLGFVGTDNEGLAGLESRYDGILKGSPGQGFFERDARGREIPTRSAWVSPSKPGADLALTIDREIQFEAESALAEAVSKYGAGSGTIIVLKPSTGEILALANSPTFDPNRFAESDPSDRKNRGLLDIYEPGSANKVITAAAALETGVVKPDEMMRVSDRIRVANKTFSDAHDHKTWNITFAEVIERSSNVGTIMTAQKLGRQNLYDYLKRFGYGHPSGLGFPGEPAGIVPKPDDWWGTSLPTIAIGQGVAVTALQIAGVYSTVANGGVWVQPRLVTARIDESGSRHPSKSRPGRRVIRQDTASSLTGILLRVTEGPNGTGKQAIVPGYQVAGKTGTASKPKPGARGYEGYMASFMGFAPAGDPAVVVGVVLDDPRPIWGGVTAAPAFSQVMQFTLRHLGIGPGPVLPLEGSPLPASGRSGGVSGSAGPD